MIEEKNSTERFLGLFLSLVGPLSHHDFENYFYSRTKR